MKNLFKSLAFVALSAATFTACNDDACKDVECGTYGTCNEGTCLCEAYYEQDSTGKCEVLQRAKFLSTAYAVSETCTHSTANYSSSITAGTELNQVLVSNMWDQFGNAVRASVSGSSLTIDKQAPDSDGFYIQGSASIEGTTVTFTVTISDERDPDDISSTSCTFVYVR